MPMTTSSMANRIRILPFPKGALDLSTTKYIRSGPYAPFPDQVTMRLSGNGVDLATVFGGCREKLRALTCGQGSIRGKLDHGHLVLSASPLQIVQGQNNFPMYCNGELMTRFLAEVELALCGLVQINNTLDLYVNEVPRIDFTYMVRFESVAEAKAVFRMLRMLLRCFRVSRYSSNSGSVLGRLRARSLYNNTIVFDLYSDVVSLKIYRKSGVPESTLSADDDVYIRFEVTVSSTCAPKLVGIDRELSLLDLMNYAGDIFAAVMSGCCIMKRQLKTMRPVRSPVPEYAAAYDAWFLHGWTKDLYKTGAAEIVRAYRAVGIDLTEPPVPARVAERFRTAMHITVDDLLDPARVVSAPQWILPGPPAPPKPRMSTPGRCIRPEGSWAAPERPPVLPRTGVCSGPIRLTSKAWLTSVQADRR
jgi:hypothetical protein